MRIQRWSVVPRAYLSPSTPAAAWRLPGALLALLLLSGCGDESSCGPGEEMVGGQCVPECEGNEVWINGTCRPECPDGQEYVGNACMAPCEDDTELVDGMCQTEFDVTPMVVRLNSVGFIPDRVKLAAITGGTLSIDPPPFSIRHVADDAVAYEGVAETPLTENDTGELLWPADFTDFAEAGEYYLDVEGIGRSPNFVIGEDAFDEALHTMMLGLTGQRCGMEVEFVHNGRSFHHGACHLEDGSMEFVDGSSDIKDTTRGWHDAGDYGKYTTNGAHTVAVVLKAWEHFTDRLEQRDFDVPEHGASLPDFLAEAKWQLDWLLRMQFEDGTVSHKVTPVGFAGTVMPENDNNRRYVSPWGTPATGAFVGAIAQAARIYEPYDADFASTLLEAAELSYQVLQDEPSTVQADLSDYSNAQYNSWGDSDHRAWAACELWETTGSAEALTDCENRVTRYGSRINWGWNDPGNLAAFTYALSSREGRNESTVAAVESNITSGADELVNNATRTRYGRGLGSNNYYWGQLGQVARSTVNLQVAYILTGDDRYRDALVQQIDHILGRNFDGRSMATGIGHFPPVHPHHRPSEADDDPQPWPGMLIGGAQPGATNWEDDAGAYTVNEVAIDYSSGLLYALAAFGP